MNDLKQRYHTMLRGINEYKTGIIDFRSLITYVVPMARSIAHDCNYKDDVDEFVDAIDYWSEIICYALGEDQKFGLEFANFFEGVINNGEPLILSREHPILKNFWCHGQ